MAHTRFYDDRRLVLPGRVPAYSSDKTGFRVNWSTEADNVGAGGVMSTVDDLFRWDQNFYHNRLGKGTLLRELQTPGVPSNGKPIEYALGLFMSTYRGLPIVEHPGLFLGYNTEILRFPEEHFGSLVDFDDSGGATKVTIRKGTDVVFVGSRVEPFTVSPSDLAVLAGTYASSELNTTYKLTVQNGTLVLQPNWKPPVKLAPLTRDEFDGPIGGVFSGTLVFHKEPSGTVSGFSLFSGATLDISFERIK